MSGAAFGPGLSDRNYTALYGEIIKPAQQFTLNSYCKKADKNQVI